MNIWWIMAFNGISLLYHEKRIFLKLPSGNYNKECKYIGTDTDKDKDKDRDTHTQTHSCTHRHTRTHMHKHTHSHLHMHSHWHTHSHLHILELTHILAITHILTLKCTQSNIIKHTQNFPYCNVISHPTVSSEVKLIWLVMPFQVVYAISSDFKHQLELQTLALQFKKVWFTKHLST